MDPGREALLRALAAEGGNRTRAAKALGLSHRLALYRLARKHGIDLSEIPTAVRGVS